MCDESRGSFEFVLRSLKDAVPEWTTDGSGVLVESDQDPAIAAAIKAQLPKATHRLCTWHVMRNVTTNITGALGSDAKAYLQAFRRAIHATSEAEFLIAWQELEKISAQSAKATSYTEHLRKIAPQFADHTVGHLFTAGIRSTQRVESVNAVIKRVSSTGSTLEELRRQLELLDDDKRSTTKTRVPSIAQDEQLTFLQTAVSPAVAEIIFEQLEMVLLYTVKDDDMILKTGTNITSATISAKKCSCPFSAQMGLPCRHLMAWRHHHGHTLITKQDVATRWLLHQEAKITPARSAEPPARPEPPSDLSEPERRRDLLNVAQKIVSNAAAQPAAFAMAYKALQGLLEELLQTFSGSSTGTFAC